MLEATGAVRIARSPEVVFDYLADARNEPKWLPGATDLRLTSAEPVGAGSTFEGTYARAGRVRLSVTRAERPTVLVIHGDGRSLSFDDEIRLAPDGAGGSELNATMRTQPRGLFRLMAPM